MLHVGGLNTPLRGGKNMGYEGGVRVVGFMSHLKEDDTQILLPRGLKYEGLMHASDWLPTLTSIADGVTHSSTESFPTSPVPPPSTSSSFSDLQRVCHTQDVPSSPRGHGVNQWCAIVTNGSSPRTDAVLALDDVTNFVSYIRYPYKLMIGYIGSGEWSKEPTGKYLFDNASYLQIWEEWVQEFLDYHFESRDISFFWHEVLHLMINRFHSRINGRVDYSTLGRGVLGSAESGDVLASTEFDRSEIPIEVFLCHLSTLDSRPLNIFIRKVYNIVDDPEERNDLSKSSPDLVADLVRSFNEHWRDHPKQVDWGLSCLSMDHLQHLPAEFCSSRTSHLNTNMAQKGVSASIPCRFERPFIADDDPSECGHGRSARDIKMEFQNQMKDVAMLYLLMPIAIGTICTVYTIRRCLSKIFRSVFKK
jgi:hypothetical protein